MMRQASTQDTVAAPLPALRSDLTIDLAAERGRSFPAIVITDAVRGSYIRLSWPESGVLLHWSEAKTIEHLREILARTYGAEVRSEQIESVIQFAFANQLTETDQAGSWQRYASIRSSQQHGWIKTLVHNYLFFRLPLLHPEPLLKNLLPRTAFVFLPAFWAVLGVLAVAALYFASRHWSAVVSALEGAFRLEGLTLYVCALLCLKGVHEFGHALATARYGCRVPTMGVAFMLGAPVLYTDTSDSWRLAKRSERLTIVFAGVAAELVVATIALWLWVLLPDGLLRHLCFAFATTSIVLSLAVNLNPLMKFDGYFALSDYLEAPNLQARAFDLLSWRLREALFDLQHPAPEQLSASRRRVFIIYAVLTAIYRLFLYIGIAAVVYLMAGKAIGIILALIEIFIFIGLPIYREIMVWVGLRSQILQRRRAYTSVGSLVSLSLALCVPWISSIEVPAIVAAPRDEAIHLPSPARLVRVAVRDGQAVKAGDVLFIAVSTDLENQRAKIAHELRALELQAKRLHASEKEREVRVVVESKLLRAREKLDSLDAQRSQLELRAPFDGSIVDVDPDIAPGVWLNNKRPLARLISSSGHRGIAFARGQDVDRIHVGSLASFIPDDAALPRLRLRLTNVAPGADGRLLEPALADRHGGSIPAVDERGDLVTRQPLFALTLEAEGMRTLVSIQRGVVHVSTDRVSPAAIAWKHVMKVLVREQAF